MPPILRNHTTNYSVATALTVYGIETPTAYAAMHNKSSTVATVLTVYGIETD